MQYAATEHDKLAQDCERAKDELSDTLNRFKAHGWVLAASGSPNNLQERYAASGLVGSDFEGKLSLFTIM